MWSLAMGVVEWSCVRKQNLSIGSIKSLLLTILLLLGLLFGFFGIGLSAMLTMRFLTRSASRAEKCRQLWLDVNAPPRFWAALFRTGMILRGACVLLSAVELVWVFVLFCGRGRLGAREAGLVKARVLVRLGGCMAVWTTALHGFFQLMGLIHGRRKRGRLERLIRAQRSASRRSADAAGD